MSKVDKINELVQTVRNLNWEVRPKIDGTPGGNPPGNPLHTALGEIRDNEVIASRMIRGMSLADRVAQTAIDQSVHQEPAERVSSRQLLSEFGTARESILSLLRTINDEDWVQKHETDDGERSMEEVVDDLISSDRTYLDRIHSAVS